MKNIYINLFLLVAVFPAFIEIHAQQSDSPVDPPISRVSDVLFDDFETGEVYGWEPYPYQQDMGYDALFYAQKEPTYNDSKYSLSRSVRANDSVELEQGFTKRINLFTTSDTRLQVAVYFQGDRKPATLEIALGTFDGRLFTHTIQNPEANQWNLLDIPISDFTYQEESLSADEHIQVVTLKGSYPIVYHLKNYTILIDNFRMNGERQRRFTATNPVSTTLEMYDISILNKHFFYGETIGMDVSPEPGDPLQSVRGVLQDSEGNVIADNISFSRSGDEWSNDTIYRLQGGEARGQWQLNLIGETNQGEQVRWNFLFLMPGDQIEGHPRLFFSAAELEQRLQNEKSPVARKILDNALSDKSFMTVDVDGINEGIDRSAENLTGGPYAKYYSGFRTYDEWFQPMLQLGKIIEEGSMYYAFTGDRTAGQQAKKALIKLSSFNKWNAAWMIERKFYGYFQISRALEPVAKGYDMLYDLLTEEERRLVRTAIIEKGLKMFHRDMVEMNRKPSNLTNHIAVQVASQGLAATAIYGDDPDNPHMEPYLSGILTKAKSFIDRTYYEDGSYGEPKRYSAMATRNLVELMAVIERNFGVEWSTTTNIESFYKYPLQASHPSGLIPDFGDTENLFDGFTENHSQWFVHRTGNRYIYNYVKPFWESGHGGFMGYLWYRDDLKPASREQLPTSRVFDDAQGIVMRSGWDEASSIISLRVGPHSNHYHFDQGTFQIMTNGNTLLTDPGMGKERYYRNLDFQSYNIQAIAHNVMLIDYDPESQTPADVDNGIAALQDWPRMNQAFAGEFFDVVEADLATVYKDKLDFYSRTLMYTKTGPLFLFDQVKSASSDSNVSAWMKKQYSQVPPTEIGGEGHTFNWVFHAQMNENSDGNHRRSVRYDAEQQRMSIDRPKARLTMDVVSPQIESSKIRDQPDESEPESFLMLNSQPNLQNSHFLAVLLPEARPSSGSYGSRPQTQRIEEDGWLGARVERESAVDFGFFRTSGKSTDSPEETSIEGFTTDAERFMATYTGSGQLQKVYFEGSTFETDGLAVSSSAPVTIAIGIGLSGGSSGRQVEVMAIEKTELKISVESQPSQVLEDGEQTRNWSYVPGSNSVTLQVSKGRTDFTIQ